MPAPPPPPPCAPPPPGPPPGPPKMKMGGGGPDSGRNNLLKSIQQGKALKKTVTVDKSKPILGKTTSSSAGGPPLTNGRTGGGTGASAGNGGGMGSGGPQLGGLFAGGMPKLKPAGGTLRRSPPDDDIPRKQSAPSYGRPNGGPALTLEEELAQKFNKKKKSDAPPVTAENLKYVQRGPPPQPPVPTSNVSHNNVSSHLNEIFQQPRNSPSTPAATTTATSPNWNYNGAPSSTTTTTKTQFQTLSLVTTNTQPISSSTQPKTPLLANKSSLFNTNISNFTINPVTSSYAQPQQQSFAQATNMALQSQISLQSQYSVTSNSSMSSQTGNGKPVPNYGKPNLAPKPPAQQLLSVKTNGRATVSRHHSMKSPRSPPIAVANPFGTIRHPPTVPMSAVSVEAINRPTMRPQGPPPRPPTSKPPPPPPSIASLKSQSQTNLPSLALSLPRDPVGGSATNLNNGMSNLQLGGTNGYASSTSSIEAPIIPPHRNPAPPPPKQSKNQPAVRPPTPPKRDTSLSNNQSQAPPPPQSRYPLQPNMNKVNRLVVDLEAKFQFHKVTDFPQPPPFLNVEKSYPSRLITNSTKQPANVPVPNPNPNPPLKKKSKQRAPNPPVVKDNFPPQSASTPINSSSNC